MAKQNRKFIKNGSKVFTQDHIYMMIDNYLALNDGAEVSQTEFCKAFYKEYKIKRRMFSKIMAEYYGEPVSNQISASLANVLYSRVGNNIMVTTDTSNSNVFLVGTPEFKLLSSDIDAYGYIKPETYAKIEAGLYKDVALSINIKIQGDKLFYKEFEISDTLANTIVDQYKKGAIYTTLTNLLERCLNNRMSLNVVEQMYRFIKSNDITVNPDGTLNLFKVVNNDEKFTDVWTKTVPNFPGTTVFMDRILVHNDPNVLCAAGLHVCAEKYIPEFSEENTIVIRVVVKPEDIVSIPTDYNDSKMRCCEYKVLGIETKDTSPQPYIHGVAIVGSKGLLSYTTK